MNQKILYSVFIFTFSFFFISCQVNDKVLNEDKMKAILKDFFLVDIENQSQNFNPYFKDSIHRIQYRTILKKHQVTDSQFVQSYRYYLETPQKIKEILEGIKAQ